MAIDIRLEYGSVTIDKEVIAKIAGYSALKSYGIVGMASQSTKEDIFEILKIEYINRGVNVDVEDGLINIDLNVILEYGIKFEVVSQNIIDNVKYNIKTSTGLDVDNVNVIVRGVRID